MHLPWDIYYFSVLKVQRCMFEGTTPATRNGTTLSVHLKNLPECIKKKFFTARREILIKFVTVKGKYIAVVFSIQSSSTQRVLARFFVRARARAFGESAWRGKRALPLKHLHQKQMWLEEGKYHNKNTSN